MLDLVIRNARLPDATDRLVDIGIEDGRIAAIEPSIAADAPSHDAEGCLCCGGFIETHIHLDKSRIIDRCAPETERQAMAVKRVSDVKPTFTVEDVYTRAKATLEEAIKNGTTRMRTHVEVDPRVGIRGFEGVQALVDEYAWAIDLELCVFPQEGLTNNPGTDELMVEGLDRGAKVVGAAPGYDTDHPGQIRRVFELAREYDVDVDMHLDFGNSPDDLDTNLVCDLTEEYGYGGRVALGHATKLSTLPPEDQIRIAKRLADSGVAVTILPATDLFLMGRDQHHNVRRGLVDANLFVEHGCNCSISSNNILNPFTPFGDCSLLRMANLHANVLQISHADRLAACFDMLTTRSAALMNLRDYGIAVGNPADIVVIDAETTARAVQVIAQPLAVFKAGRRTVTRTRPELHRP
ncbi:amidohydrolase family protein [Acuticoccus kandeliae]|uniref:amidohydrolase family protein n=1 Tax=Acuticoccus kandeliae TaxID=2073160 RepID=UPI000D3E3461|nr:amidohydrolase family protein [Acuticoccus kandeliae]